MSYDYQFHEAIHLHVKGRIDPEDAQRQKRTAQALLRRLKFTPGQILADEVGMGKTFVALAVAASVHLNDRQHRPVVIMVPPGLRPKWERDLDTFRGACLAPEVQGSFRGAAVSDAVSFLKLLDDPAERRNSIIIVEHGTMQSGKRLADPWIKLAVIQRATKNRWGAESMRSSIAGLAAELLRQGVRKLPDEKWLDLLQSSTTMWKDQLDLPDDPVPDAVMNVLEKVELGEVWNALYDLPERKTDTWKSRVNIARSRLGEAINKLWQDCIAKLNLSIPLLILDEAHHLKNSETKLASLFHAKEAADDADEVSRGTLTGAFERMLFLTATPFQLGHQELCSVLDRFNAISWNQSTAPVDLNGSTITSAQFIEQLNELRDALDAFQSAAVRFDANWGQLRREHMTINGISFSDHDSWWNLVMTGRDVPEPVHKVRERFQNTLEYKDNAEEKISAFVIRNLRSRTLPKKDLGEYPILRREKLAGRSIIDNQPNDYAPGLSVEGAALLPFLLAARATALSPTSRPVFAEGLASSFSAFLDTRSSANTTVQDGDADHASEEDEGRLNVAGSSNIGWYVTHMEKSIRTEIGSELIHPKVAATVNRAIALWKAGEKVLVFCHYLATGRELRSRISRAMQEEIQRLAVEKTGLSDVEAMNRLEHFGDGFYRGALMRSCNEQVGKLVAPYNEQLSEFIGDIQDIVRRYLRTPSFLVRFFPLDSINGIDDPVAYAFAKADQSGMTLTEILNHFIEFLAVRCGKEERRRYLETLLGSKTGALGVLDVESVAGEESAGSENVLPNVRLANGTIRKETREKLMLAFNTPFYPEILVASQVMSEGVDLHHYCRHIIHHDLCWNPSSLEQRTGRVDRIGAKVERCRKPVQVYLPYVAETQDQKMYQVVMDRDRWFNVMMGESYSADARSLEKFCERIPLPESAATELTFRLNG